MPATYTTTILNSKTKAVLVDFDPDSASATKVTLDRTNSVVAFPIATFRRFRAALFHSVGTGSVTSFKIYAATASDGTGNTAVVAHAIGTAPDAVGDTIWLEADAEQVKEVLSTATHVGVEIALVTSTDECVVFFEMAEPFYGPSNALTGDIVI